MDTLKTEGLMMLAEVDQAVELAHTKDNQLVVMCEQGPIFIDLQELNKEIVATHHKKVELNMGDMLATGGPTGCIKMRT